MCKFVNRVKNGKLLKFKLPVTILLVSKFDVFIIGIKTVL